jgi:hypothetical protein
VTGKEPQPFSIIRRRNEARVDIIVQTVGRLNVGNIKKKEFVYADAERVQERSADKSVRLFLVAICLAVRLSWFSC